MAVEEYREITSRLERIERRMLAQKEVLSLDELAEYTGWKKSHIYRMTSQRTIPFYKPMGGNIFFKRSEIDEWLLRNRQSTAEELSSKATTRLVTSKMIRKNG